MLPYPHSSEPVTLPYTYPGKIIHWTFFNPCHIIGPHGHYFIINFPKRTNPPKTIKWQFNTFHPTSQTIDSVFLRTNAALLERQEGKYSFILERRLKSCKMEQFRCCILPSFNRHFENFLEPALNYPGSTFGPLIYT